MERTRLKTEPTTPPAPQARERSLGLRPWQINRRRPVTAIVTLTYENERTSLIRPESENHHASHHHAFLTALLCNGLPRASAREVDDVFELLQQLEGGEGSWSGVGCGNFMLA